MFPEVTERVLTRARQNAEKDTLPAREALAKSEANLAQVKEEIDSLVASMTSGQLNSALLRLLNERANELQLRRELLLKEHHQLKTCLVPVEKRFDEMRFKAALEKLIAVLESSEPENLQKMLRLMVKGLRWGPDGTRRLHIHNPRSRRKESGNSSEAWFDHSLRFDGPDTSIANVQSCRSSSV